MKLNTHSLKSLKIFSIFVIVFVVVLTILETSKVTNVNDTPPNNYPPLSTNTPLTNTNNPADIQIIQIEPQNNTSISVGNTQTPITIVFNQPIDASSVEITTIPQTILLAKTSPLYPNNLIISPKTPWISDQNYNITINSGFSNSTNSVFYPQKIILQYHILPSTPPLFSNH